jgi:hypothetical protein
MSYGNYPQPNRVNNGYSDEGAKLAKQSWIYALVGIFIFGIILGPVALVKANKAKALGADATTGFVLGIICTAVSYIWFFYSLSKVLG